jgi:hypothetical protein
VFNNLREIFASKNSEEAVFMSIINNINGEHEPLNKIILKKKLIFPKID